MENWFEVEFILLKVLRLQPDVLDKMEFYRAEFLMDNLKAYNDKEKEHRKKDEDNQNSSSSFSTSAAQSQASQMMKSAGKGMPSMPNFGSFKL